MNTNSYILHKKFDSIVEKPFSKYIPFILLFFIMLFVHKFIVMYSDDSWFYNESKKQEYWEYISFRFNNWTGRMSVETTAYFIFKTGLMLWKIINPAMIALFAYFFSRILTGKDINFDKKVHFLFNCLCCFLIGYINISVTSSSIFWATGSMYYLWVVVATLIALIPYRDSVAKKYNFNLLHFLGFMICAAFGAFGQEQSSFVMLIAAIAFLGYDLIINKRVQVPLIFETIIIIICSIILFKAPGNSVRFQAEMERWYPNFADITLVQHLLIGIQWFLNFIINEAKVIVVFIWLILSKNIYDKYKGSNKRWIALVPMVGAILLSLSIISISSLLQIPSSIDFDAILKRYLFTFCEISKNIGFTALLPYLIWGGFLLLTPVLTMYLFGKSAKTSISILVLVLAFCSAAMMFFSPTIFASGHRVFFTTSILFLVFLGILILENPIIIKPWSIFILSLFPLFQLLLVVIMWIKEHRTFI